MLCCALDPSDETPFEDAATEDAAASISRCAAAVLAMAEVVIDGNMLGPVTVTVIPEPGPAPPPEDPVLEPEDPVFRGDKINVALILIEEKSDSYT